MIDNHQKLLSIPTPGYAGGLENKKVVRYGVTRGDGVIHGASNEATARDMVKNMTQPPSESNLGIQYHIVYQIIEYGEWKRQ